MRHLLSVLSIAILLSTSAQSPRSLVLTFADGTEQRTFHDGQRISVEFDPFSQRTRGRLRILNDSTIRLGDSEVPVRSIRSVREKKFGHRVGGFTGILVGGLVGTLGVAAVITKENMRKNDATVSEGFSKGGVIMTLIGGGIVYLGAREMVQGRSYGPKTGGSFVVR